MGDGMRGAQVWMNQEVLFQFAWEVSFAFVSELSAFKLSAHIVPAVSELHLAKSL